MAQQQITGQVGQTGPITSGAPGIPIRQGNYGEVVVTELHGRYYENSIRGNVFCACQTAAAAAIALAAGGATLTLSNPNNSQKNLILQEIVLTIEAQTAATQQVSFYIGGAVMGATQTYTTKLNPYSNIVVGTAAAPTGIPAVSTTFSNTAVPYRYVCSISQAATATTGVTTVCSVKDDIGGAIIIPPGSYIGVYGLSGGTLANASIASSIVWAEFSSVIL
jgi:hypothetical protein